MEIKDLVFIFCDNTSAINISNNPMMHIKTKHIAIKYHCLRELVQDQKITKDEFLYRRGRLGVIPLSKA